MVLFSYFHFSSWKFGGWGMYATPNPTNPFIEISLIFWDKDKERGPPRPVFIFQNEKDISQLIWRFFSFQIFESSPNSVGNELRIIWPSSFWLPIVRDDIQRIEMFQSANAIRDLADFWKTNLPVDRKLDKIDIIITHRRLNVIREFLYTENFVFRLKEGRIVGRWKVSTKSQNLLASLEKLRSD